MTISGRPEIGLQDAPWTLAAHRIDVCSSQNGPNSDRNVQNLINWSRLMSADVGNCYVRCTGNYSVDPLNS